MHLRYESFMLHERDYGKNKMRKGTSIIFINKANHVLLFKRDDKEGIPFPGYWDVLGGHVEADETPEECIIREMDEEICLKLENPTLFNSYDMGDRTEYTFWQRVDFDILEIKLNEGQYLKWFTEGEIDRLSDEELAFGFGMILKDFFIQKPFE